MRERLDVLLVEAGFFSSREKARSAVMAGEVRQGTRLLDKPGVKMAGLPEDLEIKKRSCPYVSRGGLKLAKALDLFAVDPQDRICLDVGASTGGFTDCLLQRGAQKVYAVDVGRGQLDWGLRKDPRVVCLEKVNARYLQPEDLYPEDAPFASLAVMDVSFISILKILPALQGLLMPESPFISLIKPQFEAPQQDNRKGIVSSPEAHLRVLQKIADRAPESGWFLHQVSDSPIKGKTGNREFLGVFYTQAPAEAPNLEECVREK